MSKLDLLKSMTDVVADTGDIEAIEKYRPVDATTNPSLLYKAAQLPRYQILVRDSIAKAELTEGCSDEQLVECVDSLLAAVAGQIVQIVPGVVSVEVDARLSFNRQAMIDRAHSLIDRFAEMGIGKDRILIKIASTWEGIAAARVLEADGVRCNLTLLFGYSQAAACADAGVFLISPFVGRILDWYKKDTGRNSYPPAEDPGVLSVTRIYRYYKTQGYDTVVMGASFRNIGEIEALAGCDKLTISPALLEELENDKGLLERALDPSDTSDEPKLIESESEFRFSMNQDAMATEKLAEGIRNFAADTQKLESFLLNFKA